MKLFNVLKLKVVRNLYSPAVGTISQIQIVTNCYTGEKHSIAKVVNIQTVE